jgi:SecD/SecF fusion protein
MVAAILCIAGYSINETVVVFDRIREELKLSPTGSLR